MEMMQTIVLVEPAAMKELRKLESQGLIKLITPYQANAPRRALLVLSEQIRKKGNVASAEEIIEEVVNHRAQKHA